MLLHPDRYSTGAPTIRNGVVIHDSEGAEGMLPWGQQSSAQLVSLLQAKGDRPSTGGGFYGAGYQAVATETGSYITVADDNVGPYHCGAGFNPNWWSICIPGRASQTREQWLQDVSRFYIRGVARYVVDRHMHDGRIWPLSFVTGAQLVAKKANLKGHPCGYTSHAQVTVSKLTSTDHSDPGVSFPWDVLASDILDLIAPQEDDMALIVKAYDGPDLNHIDPALLDTAAFALTGGIATWTRNELALAIQQGLGTVPDKITPVPRIWLKAYDLVGPPPTPGYGYIVPGRGSGTDARDFAD